MYETLQKLTAKMDARFAKDPGPVSYYDIAVRATELHLSLQNGYYAAAHPHITSGQTESLCHMLAEYAARMLYIDSVASKRVSAMPFLPEIFALAVSAMRNERPDDHLMHPHIYKNFQNRLPDILADVSQERIKRATLDELLTIAVRVKGNIPARFYFSGAAFQVVPSANRLYYLLCDAFQFLETDKKDQSINLYYNPVSGPDTIEEMYLFLLIARRRLTDTHAGYYKPSATLHKLNALTDGVAALCKDIPIDIDALSGDIKKLADAYMIGSGEICGQLRYFYQNHGDKLTKQDAKSFETFVRNFYIASYHDYSFRRHGLFGKRDSEYAINRMFNETWKDYTIPSPEEARQSFYARHGIQASDRKARVFEDILLKRPADMKEVVTLYTPQDEERKAARKKAFNDRMDAHGRSGVKRRFLRSLAAHHADELQAIGLPDSAIRQMYETGAIPCDENGFRYDLTIEHITDRDFGGTNHAYNLILMPRKINKLKNDLIRCQVDGQDAAEPFWIISWQPVSDEDGRRSWVLKTNEPIGIDRKAPKGTPCTAYASGLNMDQSTFFPANGPVSP